MGCVMLMLVLVRAARSRMEHAQRLGSDALVLKIHQKEASISI